jgi:hypothetical protein
VRRRSLPWRYAARRVLVGRSAVTVARCRSRSGEGGAIADARLANRQLIADRFRMRADSMEACRFILAGAVPISVLAASVFLELPQDLVARCIVQQFFCSSPLGILASFRFEARRPCCDWGTVQSVFRRGWLAASEPLGAAIFSHWNCRR